MKTPTAKYILENIGRASPANACKLANPSEYEPIPFKNFFALFPTLEVSNTQREALADLQDQILAFIDFERFDKLYTYFILSLQDILSTKE